MIRIHQLYELEERISVITLVSITNKKIEFFEFSLYYCIMFILLLSINGKYNNRILKLFCLILTFNDITSAWVPKCKESAKESIILLSVELYFLFCQVPMWSLVGEVRFLKNYELLIWLVLNWF